MQTIAALQEVPKTQNKQLTASLSLAFTAGLELLPTHTF